ncbi:unnamed protein product [Ectocarpus sp. CCAP 1310/34]|nr:unnamed protein product [Ectocarpus sp. CCAP 1310/34]
MSAPTHEEAVVECDDGFDALRQKLIPTSLTDGDRGPLGGRGRDDPWEVT